MPENIEESIGMEKLTFSIPTNFHSKLDEFVKMMGYATLAELIRDSLREKLRREAPELLTPLKEEEISIKP